MFYSLSRGQLEFFFMVGLVGNLCLMYLSVLAFADERTFVASLIPFSSRLLARTPPRVVSFFAGAAGVLFVVALIVSGLWLGGIGMLLATDRIISLEQLERLQNWVDGLLRFL